MHMSVYESRNYQNSHSVLAIQYCAAHDTPRPFCHPFLELQQQHRNQEGHGHDAWWQVLLLAQKNDAEQASQEVGSLHINTREDA